MEKSAVEFLVNRIGGLIRDDVRSQLMFKSNVETANEIFKEQITDAFISGVDDSLFEDDAKLIADNYYQETFKKD
jgi:hypothetical protein